MYEAVAAINVKFNRSAKRGSLNISPKPYKLSMPMG